MSDQIDLENHLLSLNKSSSLTFVQGKDGNLLINGIYQQAKKHFNNIKVTLADESSVQNISKAELKSGKYFFVFEKFDKDNHAQKYVSVATIYGLSLIATIIDKKGPVEINESKMVFSTSFKDMIVCASNINSAQKNELGLLVKAMNGHFEKDFTDHTTHLITTSTLTVKYEVAVSRNIPVYHIDWVKKVFEHSTSSKWDDVKAIDGKYSHYILPPFFGSRIAATGFSISEKEKIEEAVEEHGGIFIDSKDFRKDSVDILIVNDNSLNEKYRSARQWSLSCLNKEWIFDSIEASHALSYDKYKVRSENTKPPVAAAPVIKQEKVEKKKPLKEKEPVDNDLTLCSQRTTETILEQFKEGEDITAKIVESFTTTLTIEKAKKAGPIFDGMCFNILDFSFAENKILKKILMTCGGWCTELNEKVTHVICLGIDSEKSIQSIANIVMENNWSPSVVKVDWIMECVSRGYLLPPKSEYIVRDYAARSESGSKMRVESKTETASKFYKKTKSLSVNNGNKAAVTNSAQKRKMVQNQTNNAKRPKMILEM